MGEAHRAGQSRWSNLILIGRVAVMRQNIERPNGTEQSRARGVGLWIMDRIGSGGKTAMDEWIGEFEKRAGPRLRDIFESPEAGLSTEIAELLEGLRKKEKANF